MSANQRPVCLNLNIVNWPTKVTINQQQNSCEIYVISFYLLHIWFCTYGIVLSEQQTLIQII